MTIDTTPQGSTRARSLAGVLAGVVGVAAVAGGGVWVTRSFLAQGPQPAEALPADTFAYAAIDTDPGGEQKLEAARLLRKFPDAHKALGGDGDLRRQVFEFLTEDAACKASYADVEPWLGTRAAIALVDVDDPKPVLVLGVEGDEGLEQGLDALGTCLGKRSGHAVSGSWAVVAESDAVARRVVADTAKGSLAEATSFRDWTGKAGGAGLVTVYAGPTAGSALVGFAEKHPEAGFVVPSLLGQGDPLGSILSALPLFGVMASAVEPISGPAGVAGGADEGDVAWEEGRFPGEPEPLTPAESKRLETMSPEEIDAFFAKRYGTSLPTEVMSDEDFDDLPPEQRERMLEEDQAELEEELGAMPAEDFAEEDFAEEDFFPKLPAETTDALRDFGGLGGSLRFEDGTLQLKVVADHLGVGAMRLTGGADAGRLLDGLPPGVAAASGGGLADGWVDAVMESFFAGTFGPTDDDSMAREFERSTGLDLPGDLETLGGRGVAFVAGPGFDPDELFDGKGTVPVAAVLHGDGDAIVRVLARIEAKRHDGPRRLLWKQDGDRVVVGIDQDFVDHVARGSGLAGSPAFRKVLPDADTAASATFIDFDAQDWLVHLVGKHDRPSVEQLDSVGFARTVTGGDDVIRVRLATD